MHVIGLTGGIASGKSTISAMLVDHGAVLLDADLIGHRTYEPGGPAYDGVVENFGPDIITDDGTIDRRRLGAKVFSDPSALKRLTDVVWPAIKVLAIEELSCFEGTGTEVAVLEAAVLIEANWLDLTDEIWVVTVSRDIARQRLMKRNNLTAEAADQRISSQLTDAERVTYAHCVIENNGSIGEARAQVEKEWRALCERLIPAG